MGGRGLYRSGRGAVAAPVKKTIAGGLLLHGFRAIHEGNAGSLQRTGWQARVQGRSAGGSGKRASDTPQHHEELHSHVLRLASPVRNKDGQAVRRRKLVNRALDRARVPAAVGAHCAGGEGHAG